MTSKIPDEKEKKMTPYLSEARRLVRVATWALLLPAQLSLVGSAASRGEWWLAGVWAAVAIISHLYMRSIIRMLDRHEKATQPLTDFAGPIFATLVKPGVVSVAVELLRLDGQEYLADVTTYKRKEDR